MSNIAVVLSTYNGERYLRQQLESILSDVPEVRFYIRDDGSSDGTIAIIKSLFESRPENLAYFEFGGENLGPAYSYFTLLSKTFEDYVFLSDQDDVWIEGRAGILLSKMRNLESVYGKNSPALVFSDAEVVDQDLKTIDPSFWHYETNYPKHRVKLSAALIQNLSPGCTMLLNRSLVALAPSRPQSVIMHDWWLVILALSFGVVDYHNAPTLKYRQHDRNAIGAKKKGVNLSDLGYQIRSSRESLIRTMLQAQSILNLHYDMPSHSKEIIKKYIGVYSLNPLFRRFAILNNGFVKSSLKRNIGLLILI